MTTTPEPVETTPLEQRLIDLIKLKGPMSVADYMADALGHPHDGYYMRQESIGAEGDFTTAPEISQVLANSSVCGWSMRGALWARQKALTSSNLAPVAAS